MLRDIKRFTDCQIAEKYNLYLELHGSFKLRIQLVLGIARLLVLVLGIAMLPEINTRILRRLVF